MALASGISDFKHSHVSLGVNCTLYSKLGGKLIKSQRAEGGLGGGGVYYYGVIRGTSKDWPN